MQFGVLATYAYDNLGRRTSLTRGNGTVTSSGYDAALRLTSLGENLTGTAQDLAATFTYMPSGQIATRGRDNDTYAWANHYNFNRNYTTNVLNQYTLSGAITPTYDSRGNLTSAGTTTYAYDGDNLLTSATGGDSATLAYDPAGRLYQTAGSATTRFGYDGMALVGEYDGSSTPYLSTMSHISLDFSLWPSIAVPRRRLAPAQGGALWSSRSVHHDTALQPLRLA